MCFVFALFSFLEGKQKFIDPKRHFLAKIVTTVFAKNYQNSKATEKSEKVLKNKNKS